MIEPAELLGTWRFEREIDDRHTASHLHASGSTQLELCTDDRVRWSETGTLSWPGASSPISRTLFIELRSDGWFVTFDDGRDFHPWTPGLRTDHPCGDDHYRGLITIASEDVWRVEWIVHGPQKDYTMTTHLQRRASS